MSMEIEVPVGGVIRVYGSELVCVEDYRDDNGVRVSCSACPINRTTVCTHLNCGFSRTDGKCVHFEYYYRKKE